jgi:hypothetical protein
MLMVKIFRRASAVLCLVLPLLAVSETYAQNLTISCGSTVANPYAENLSTLTACGYQIFPLSHTQVLLGGGKAYVYNTEAGTTATFYVPPSGMDIVDATANQLQTYHLPPRPSDAHDLLEWKTEMSRAKFNPPGPFILGFPQSTQVTSTSGTRASDLWFGYEAYQSGVSNVDGEWVEPTTPTSGQCANATLSTWVGIGRTNVAQAGIVVTDPTAQYHTGWWEFTGTMTSAKPIPTQAFTATPGSKTRFQIQATYTNTGTDSYTIYYYNSATGSAGDTVQTEPSQYRDTSQADFMSENPTVNGGFRPLMQFQSPMQWDWAKLSAPGTSGYVGNYSNAAVTLYSNLSGRSMGHPGSLYNGQSQFNDYFDNCQ